MNKRTNGINNLFWYLMLVAARIVVAFSLIGFGATLVLLSPFSMFERSFQKVTKSMGDIARDLECL